MENATKALLIAAAILIAIIIISLGLAVVRQGQEAISNADMSDAEMETFNSKFKTYEGTHVSTSDVNALLSSVLTHNQQETSNETNRTVTMTYFVNGKKTTLAATAQTYTKVPGSSYWKVQCTYTDGLVTKITVTEAE